MRLKHRVLAERLARSRLTQNGWALRLGLGSGHLSKLANGRRPYPDPATRRRLLEGLDLRFEDLFEIEEHKARRGSARRRSSHVTAPRPVLPGGRGFLSALATDLEDDLRYSLRGLWKHPGFTLVAISTLALGIGANTFIFSIVDQVLLQPLPYPAPDELVVIWSQHPEANRQPVSQPDFLDWRAQATSFETLGAFRLRTRTVSVGGVGATTTQTAGVSVDFFSVFGLPLSQGRDFLPQEDAPGRGQVAVVAEAFWKTRLGGGTAIGSTIQMDGEGFTVVGVAAAGFRFPDAGEGDPVQIWTPLALDPHFGRRSNVLRVVGRLREGVSVDRAADEMAAIAARLAARHPATNTGWSTEIVRLDEQLVGGVRAALWTILGAVSFVMLIACTNVANLLLTRASGRGRELAVRAALGADRVRIARQLLTESVLLALAGGCGGILLAIWLSSAAAPWVPPLPRLAESSPSLMVLLFTGGVSAVTGVLFGLAPAFQGRSVDLTEAMKAGTRTGTGAAGGRIRGLLVVSEVALALVVLVGAGLMARSLNHLMRVDPGFRTDNLITFQVRLSGPDYRDRNRRALFFRDLLRDLDSLPEVTRVGAVSDVPLEGSGVFRFAIQGRPAPGDDEIQDAELIVATAGYFRTLEIPLLQGELFPETPGDERLVVINETMRRRYWPNADPIGERLRLSSPQTWYRIVGVVGDTHQGGLDREPAPQIYAASSQLPQTSMALMLRTTAGIEQLAAPIRQRVRRADPRLPAFAIRTLDDVVDASLGQARFGVVALSAFGALSVLLVTVGLYGVVSYAVSQQTGEIGVRLTLGASRASILAKVVRKGMMPVALGICFGVVGARWLSGILQGALFEVSPTDPWTFGATAALLAFVSLAACVLPAARASRVDPLIAIRSD